MKYKYLIFLLIGLTFLSFIPHKYYLSLTQMKYNTSTKSIQIIINVFMDDIELALNKDYNIDLRLTTAKELANNDIYFKKYFEKKLKFKVNGKDKEYTYIGKEYENDLVLLYLEIEDLPSVNSISIENNVLTRHFPDQQNLIKVKVQNTNKSILLDKEKNKTTFNFITN